MRATSRRLNQCWLTIKEFLWHSSQGNTYLDHQHINYHVVFKIYTFEIISTCHRSLRVNDHAYRRESYNLMWRCWFKSKNRKFNILHYWSFCLTIHYSDVIKGAMVFHFTGVYYYLLNSLRSDQRHLKAPRHWPLCGESTGDCCIARQRASNAENVSIWRRHHATHRGLFH